MRSFEEFGLELCIADFMITSLVRLVRLSQHKVSLGTSLFCVSL